MSNFAIENFSPLNKCFSNNAIIAAIQFEDFIEPGGFTLKTMGKDKMLELFQTMGRYEVEKEMRNNTTLTEEERELATEWLSTHGW